MAAPKRTPFEISRDRVFISQLYLQGKTQHEIVEELKKSGRAYTLTQPIISRDLRAVQQEWLKESVRNFDVAKAKELAKIDILEREYWHGWERSRQAKTKTQSEKKETRGKAQQSARMMKEDMLGDPRYLQGVQWCIDRRCQLLGLDAPKRSIHYTPDILRKINFDSLTKQQLERIAAGEELEKVIPGFTLN